MKQSRYQILVYNMMSQGIGINYLNARILANNVDKFARVFATMVEPAAAIDNVIFL